MNVVVALLLVLVLATCGYTAGRMHAQVSYKFGYRFGYRQGYFDGDRASWNRRRRDLQATVASVLGTPTAMRAESFRPDLPMATTYTSAAARERDAEEEHRPASRPAGNTRDWALLDTGRRI